MAGTWTSVGVVPPPSPPQDLPFPLIPEPPPAENRAVTHPTPSARPVLNPTGSRASVGSSCHPEPNPTWLGLQGRGTGLSILQNQPQSTRSRAA